MPHRRSRWRVVVGALIAAATLLFLGLTIARQWSELQLYEWKVDPAALAASVVALLLVFAWGGWVWRHLLVQLGVRANFLPLLRLWYLSSLARYIPGKVWQFVGAAQLGHRIGLNAAPLLTSMVLQMAFLMVAGAAVALPALFLADVPSAPTIAAGLLAALAAAVALVHPRVLNAALRLATRLVPRGVLRWDGSWGEGIALLGMYALSWVGQGLAFALFVHAIVDVPAAALPALIGANALAMVAGMLVFPVPAGLGAREAVLALLLSPWVPMGAAALLAVGSRLWTILTEVIGAMLMLALVSPRGDASAPGGTAATGPPPGSTTGSTPGSAPPGDA